MKQTFFLGAIVLLAGCTQQHLPAVVDMPYYDANTILPATELTQIERTDSTTELTFSAMYNYSDYPVEMGSDICLVAEDLTLPLTEMRIPGNVGFSNNKIQMSQGVPVQFKLIFPALPEDIEMVDFIQRTNGIVKNSIWGIDLTGKRLPGELPADIPAELLQNDFASGNLPGIVREDGTLRITAHAVAWRDWMSHNIEFCVNTIDDTQERIITHFNNYGEVTIDIPLKGTANISAITPYNTYSNFYADPGEDINLYILPNNYSETQRFIRPNGIIDGKYRNLKAMSDYKTDFYHHNADTLLLGKTDTNDYFATMMKIHSNVLDSIKADKFDSDKEKYLRAIIDRRLMAQTLRADAYTTSDWRQSDKARPDSISRFSPEQLRQVRASIDFENPLLEVISIGNPGSRTNYLKAKELILSE